MENLLNTSKCPYSKDNTSIAHLNTDGLNSQLNYCENCERYSSCNKVAELNDALKMLDTIQEDEKVSIVLKEDEAFDVIVNGELEVHIKRNDIGYSVDLYKHATLEEMEDDDYDFDGDYISSCTALDDDLDKYVEEYQLYVTTRSTDGSDREITNEMWVIKETSGNVQDLFWNDELMFHDMVGTDDEIIETILNHEHDFVIKIEDEDGNVIYDDTDDEDFDEEE